MTQHKDMRRIGITYAALVLHILNMHLTDTVLSHADVSRFDPHDTLCTGVYDFFYRGKSVERSAPSVGPLKTVSVSKVIHEGLLEVHARG